MAESRIGFIGIGRMGSRMASRLLDAGYDLTICDPNDAAVAPLVARGCERAGSPAAVASAAETVLVSLPTPPIVQQAALGPDGAVHGSRMRTFIDLSTTGPRMARQIAEGLAARGVVAVDAPVSGGLAGARDGTLAVMLSCPRPTFEALAPLLGVFGKLFFIGEAPGLAQTMKLANNLLSACAMAISAEAMVFGVKAGLDPRTMIDVINVSSGRNTAIQDKFPRAVLPGTFDFGFATGLCYKDVNLCLDEAEALGVPTVVGSAVRQLLGITNCMFGPDSDFTSMVKSVEHWAKVEVRG
jgi:3-hydroxyisobutyrate dehydrogenase-like beta-hydroxyacid dehydrogenase